MAKKTEDTRSQAQKFKDLAREVEADMDAKAFDGLIGGARGIEAPSKKEAFEKKRQGKAD